ncbi:TOBE domain-containing protein [Luteococcus sp. H101]|uniref:TOBE domain-containing protein n=1 Tax=Luteococcus sp. H101 TaxID=3139402 RepID=UPI00313EA08A
MLDGDIVRLGELTIVGLWEDMAPPEPPATFPVAGGGPSSRAADFPETVSEPDPTRFSLGAESTGTSPEPVEEVLATVDPAAVALHREPPGGSPRNVWPVRVTGLDPRGATVRVRLALPDGQPLAADLTAQGVAALGLAPGDQLLAQVKATQVRLHRGMVQRGMVQRA